MTLVSRLALSFAGLAAVAALGAPALANVTVMDNNKTLEVDCTKDPEVALLGNHITLTLKGTCDRITVSGNQETITGSAKSVSVTGNENTVTMDAADEVAVTGNKNTVSVRAAISRKAPKIGNLGRDNKITRPTK